MKFHTPILAAALITASIAFAQSAAHKNHTQGDEPSASTQAFDAANATMHQNMMIEYTGNADIEQMQKWLDAHPE